MGSFLNDVDRPFDVDVTAYVQERVGAGDRYVGFALRMVTRAAGRKSWSGPWLELSLSTPEAHAGPDQVLECAGATTEVVLDGSASSDPDGEPLSFQWLTEDQVLLSTDSMPVLHLPPGSHIITLVVTNPDGQQAQDTVTVTIQDTQGPAIACSTDQIVLATGPDGAVVHFPAPVASDLCAGADVQVGASHESGAVFPIGITEVVCVAADAAGNEAVCTFAGQVICEWSGVLPPVDPLGSSVFRAGQTVPLKFVLAGGSAGITDLVATLSYAKISDSVAGSVVDTGSTSGATSGDLFRYDPVGGQYVFNWSTRGLMPGTYQLWIDLGDGVERTVILGLR